MGRVAVGVTQVGRVAGKVGVGGWMGGGWLLKYASWGRWRKWVVDFVTWVGSEFGLCDLLFH